jgi:opacity protein-like surface antigen
MSSPFAPDHLRSFRHLLVGAPLAAVLLAAAPASAQDPPSCPPGSWFCADAEKPEKVAPKAQPAAPAPAAPAVKGELEPLPPAETLPPPPPPGPPPAPPGVMIYRPGPPPPPVVIYQPPPPVYGRLPPPPPYYYHPRVARQPAVGRYREWGINVRGEGMPNGGGSASTQPMLGWGFGLRYKPVPAFGLEAGFDFVKGRDYQNDWRSETAFTVNAMVFVNPRSRVQFYLLAGLGGAWANVAFNSGSDPGGSWNPGFPTTSYTYFGGQAGGGLEFRIARHFAMNVDLRGFLRTRTDSNAGNQPEFINANGQTTNTSDGALITAGMTFYF